MICSLFIFNNKKLKMKAEANEIVYVLNEEFHTHYLQNALSSNSVYNSNITNYHNNVTAYFDNLGMYGTLFLLSPLMFVGGVLVLLYPGIGLLAAPSFFHAAIMSVPDFFKALFNGPEYTVKT